LIRPVRTFPDPVLKRVCEPVDANTALSLAEDLVDTMRAHPGCVGLAAPQVGEPVRVAVIDVSDHRLTTATHGLIVLVNPEILERSGHHVAREGCLSLPDITADVARAERILVRPQASAVKWSEGFEARAIQHEIDHLDGILVLDRVTSAHGLHPRRSGRG
jgi:peptide deformylase